MPKIRVLSFALCSVAFLLMCSLVCTCTVAADPIEISFSGITGACTGDEIGPANCVNYPSTSIVTGTYSFDSATESIVGPWFFSTEFGDISSNSSQAETFVFPPSPNSNIPYYLLGFEGDGHGVFLAFANPNGYGPLLTFVTGSLPGSTGDPSDIAGILAGPEEFGFSLASGTATPVATTPEPSSLLLLGAGLLPLALTVRRRVSRTCV